MSTRTIGTSLVLAVAIACGLGGQLLTPFIDSYFAGVIATAVAWAISLELRHYGWFEN